MDNSRVLCQKNFGSLLAALDRDYARRWVRGRLEKWPDGVVIGKIASSIWGETESISRC